MEQEELVDISIENIFADSEFNCRGTIAPIDIAQLATSIEEQGLISPVIVTPMAAEKVARLGKKYLLVAGYRRFHAFILLKRTSIKAIVKNELDEAKARIINLQENLERSNLNILQEALAVSKLKVLGFNRDRCAHALGKSPAWVQIREILLKLPEAIQAEAAVGVIRQNDIRKLGSLPSEEKQFEAVRNIKTAVQRGEDRVKAAASIKKGAHNTKKIRTRGDMSKLMDHISSTIGFGLHTRVLAWASGEINDLELFQSIKEYADENGLNYAIPEDGNY